jgi:hypothetical protein
MKERKSENDLYFKQQQAEQQLANLKAQRDLKNRDKPANKQDERAK